MGVTEYVALKDTPDVTWTWNRLMGGAYDEIETDSKGRIESVALPGLWIPVSPLKNRDWWAVMTAIA